MDSQASCESIFVSYVSAIMNPSRFVEWTSPPMTRPRKTYRFARTVWLSSGQFVTVYVYRSQSRPA